MYRIVTSTGGEAKLCIMVGLPLSGKSTYVKTLQEDRGYTVVSPDTIRLAMHGREFQKEAEPFVWATAEVMVRALLMDGHRVVVDATNTTKEARARWWKVAREVGCYWNLATIIMPTLAETCIQRARDDGKEYMVPIIERMAEQWEQPATDEMLRV